MDEIYRVVREHVYTYPQTLAIYISVCVAFGTLCASVTTHKSGGPGAGFVLGFLLLVVGWMFCLLIPYKPIDLIQKQPERQRRFHANQHAATLPQYQSAPSNNDQTVSDNTENRRKRPYIAQTRRPRITQAIRGNERDNLLDKLDERTK